MPAVVVIWLTASPPRAGTVDEVDALAGWADKLVQYAHNARTACNTAPAAPAP